MLNYQTLKFFLHFLKSSIAKESSLFPFWSKKDKQINLVICILTIAYFYDSHQDHYTVHVRTTNSFMTATIATKSANKITATGGDSVLCGRSVIATAITTVDSQIMIIYKSIYYSSLWQEKRHGEYFPYVKSSYVLAVCFGCFSSFFCKMDGFYFTMFDNYSVCLFVSLEFVVMQGSCWCLMSTFMQIISFIDL